MTCEIGTATGLDQVVGTVIEVGTKMNELTGTETTTLDGTLWMTDEETESGTLLHSIMTAELDEAIVMKTDDGNPATTEVGTTTIELEDHELGTTTDEGVQTQLDEATDEIYEEAIVPMTESGIELGMADHETIATPLVMIYSVDGHESTTEVGTKTGLDQVVGT